MERDDCDCEDKAQCWEPCGDLGHSEENAKVSEESFSLGGCCSTCNHWRDKGGKGFCPEISMMTGAMASCPCYDRKET